MLIFAKEASIANSENILRSPISKAAADRNQQLTVSNAVEPNAHDQDEQYPQ